MSLVVVGINHRTAPVEVRERVVFEPTRVQDALRDLATPAMGHPPLVLIAAVDGDGVSAYRRHRASFLTLRAP